MEGFSEEQVRFLIGQFYDNHRDEGKSFTVSHFQTMGMARSTVYSVIKDLRRVVELRERRDQEENLANCLLFQSAVL